MRFTWTNVTERRIVVSNFSVTRNSLFELHTLDRLRHVSALPEYRLRRRHVLKYATQLPCIRRLTFRRLVPTSYHFFSQVSPFDRDKHLRQILSLSLANFPFSIWPQRFCHYSIWTISSAVRQPDDVRTSTFPQTDNRSWSCRTSILEDAIFHKMSYCKFL